MHVNGSHLYVVDLEEGVDLVCDLSSRQHREPILLLHVFGHLNFSLKLRVHDLRETNRHVGIRGLKLHSCTTNI